MFVSQIQEQIVDIYTFEFKLVNCDGVGNIIQLYRTCGTWKAEREIERELNLGTKIWY